MGINYAGDCAWASVAGIKVIAAAAMLQIEVPRGCSDDGPRQRSPAFGSHRIFLFRATPASAAINSRRSIMAGM
jgi:hypothetical protein